ncbi:MAG: response regulator [Promethearchaeota archaeon]
MEDAPVMDEGINLDDILNSIQEGISILDRDLTVLKVNQIMKNTYQENLPLVGKKCYVCYQNASIPCDPCPSLRCLETGVTESAIVKGPPDSPVEWIELYAYPVKDAKTGEVTKVIEFVRDITERTRILNDLYQERTQQRIILNGISSNITLVDENLTIKWVNSTAAKSVGKTPSEIIGLKCYENWANFDHPCDNCPSLKAIESGKTSRYVRKTTEGVIWDEKSEPIYDLNGNLVGIVEMATDITDQRKAEKKLIEAQKMDSIGNLAAGVAHDFNNMLGGIIGYTSLLLQEEKNEEKRGFLDGILHAANRSSDLTQKLLAFGRRGKNLVQSVDLNTVIKKVFSILKYSIAKTIMLKTEFDENLCNIAADPSQMNQLVMNLTVNAAEAMPEGGILLVKTKNIQVDDSNGTLFPDLQPGNYIQLIIKDTGIGIDEETKKHLFEPFFTTKKEGKVKGTGLGLATAYGIVKNHAGIIDVFSKENEGATFTLYFPQVNGNESKENIQELKEGKKEEIYNSDYRKTILIVEDEELIRKMLIEITKKLGYSVLFAENGLMGVEIYLKYYNTIDLVILDMIMPIMGGKEAYIKIKEINPKVKVLLSTGFGQNEEAQSLLNLGINGLLAKPYEFEEFSKKIQEILEN